MKKLILTISLFLLTAITAPVAFAGFSIIPADSNIRQFSFELNPGENRSASVVIDNLSDEEITVHLYGADGTQSNLGTFAITTSGAEQWHIGKWVNFANNNIKIPPRGRKEVPFVLRVPADATPGVYSGGIAAEAATPAKALGAGSTGSTVSTTSRVAVKLFVSVAGEKINKVEWQDFNFVPGEDGARGSFKLAYENKGNTINVVEQKIQISGFFGIGAQEIELPTATILQGKKVDVSSKWDDEPFFGFYTAKAVMKFSEYDIISNTKKNSHVESKEVNIFVPLKAGTAEGKILITVAVVVLLFLLSLLLMVLERRHALKNSRSYTVQEGDTVEDLAAANNISWKNLAKLNKLKPPYNLKAGQKILLPGSKK